MNAFKENEIFFFFFKSLSRFYLELFLYPPFISQDLGRGFIILVQSALSISSCFFISINTESLVEMQSQIAVSDYRRHWFCVSQDLCW